MPKKKPIIHQRLHLNKKTDEYEVRFYAGNKRATEAEKRAHLKASYGKIDKTKLSKEDALYYSRIEGGKKRSEQSIRSGGKFLSKIVEEKSGLTKAAKNKGYKNAADMLKAEPELYKAIERFIEGEPLSDDVNSWQMPETIDSFKGKIFINGKQVTKMRAIALFELSDKAIMREFDSYVNMYNVVYKKGGAEMHIKIPTPDEIETMEADELADYDIVFHSSPAPKKKKSKKEKEPEENNRLFRYKYKALFARKKPAFGVVYDINIEAARTQVKQIHPTCIAVIVHRKPYK